MHLIMKTLIDTNLTFKAKKILQYIIGEKLCLTSSGLLASLFKTHFVIDTRHCEYNNNKSPVARFARNNILVAQQLNQNRWLKKWTCYSICNLRAKTQPSLGLKGDFRNNGFRIASFHTWFICAAKLIEQRKSCLWKSINLWLQNTGVSLMEHKLAWLRCGNVECDWKKKRQQFYYEKFFKILKPPRTENSIIRNRKFSIYSSFKGSGY